MQLAIWQFISILHFLSQNWIPSLPNPTPSTPSPTFEKHFSAYVDLAAKKPNTS
jgi:hypothetical protein